MKNIISSKFTATERQAITDLITQLEALNANTKKERGEQ